MKKHHFSIFLLMGFYFLGLQLPVAGQIKDKWNGTVTFNQTVTGPVMKFSTIKITVTITDNRVTGMITWDSETVTLGNCVFSSSCAGEGAGVLQRVDISEMSGEYSIDIVSPRYTCTGNNCGQIITSEGTKGIAISGKMSETNRNLLTGTTTTTVDIGAGMKGTTTKSWSLYRGPLDAVLIVSPVGYNNWMPRATADELRKGNAMNINLKVQKRNGGDSPFKVSRFELKLDSTSSETGTTLNFPLDPPLNQLPDLRLLPDSIAESIKADQYIEINSTDGKTGYFSIGSYDGGGWTTLTAVAVLEGGIRIEGTLLTPTGVKKILIPKRKGDSKIATAWLAANGNPGEMDDKETLPIKEGDGLTAYEEYRGVISEGQFLRLKPNEKELGVMATKANHALFAEGVRWFENASGIKVIRFDETEIGADRRLNKNFLSAHDYDQYVLKLENGTIEGDAVGMNEPIRRLRGIPKQSDRIVIDIQKIKDNYQHDTATGRAGNEVVPYTYQEKLDNTVAHEIGHGVNLIHHGDEMGPYSTEAPECTTTNPCYTIYRIYDHHNNEILKRPIPLSNAGAVGSEESGDLSCIMAYTGMYQWAYKLIQREHYYYYVTFQPVGKKLCTSTTGRGINANNKYFGNAEDGNCLSQLKLRD